MLTTASSHTEKLSFIINSPYGVLLSHHVKASYTFLALLYRTMLGENKNYSRIGNLDVIDNVHRTSRFNEVATNLIREYIVDVVDKWAIRPGPRVVQ